jgi:hypothetical protein
LCPIARITRVIAGFADAFDVHARECGDRVVGVALNATDHDELALVELWGLPVLATAEVEQGNSKLLCEAEGVLIPPIETGQDLVDHWRYQLERPLPAEDRLAAS